MTSSLGTGRIDDSIAMSAMMPGEPRSRSVCSSQLMARSSIEAVLADEGDKAGFTDRRGSNTFGGATDQGEGLRALRPPGDNHAARGRGLFDQRGRGLGAPRRDERRG